jgi:mannose-6-phosphate isomerase-like protein (cupin superfamily)
MSTNIPEEIPVVDTLKRPETAHLVEPEDIATLSVLGPTIQVLTPPEADDAWPCLMRGTIPPGVVIPMHAHADPETFIIVSGEVEGLALADDEANWIRIGPGDIFHVPGGARHAWRNPTSGPVAMFIVSTSKLARFFQEVGVPVQSGAPPDSPSPEALRHFQAVSERYGYWNATPEENAQVGISLAYV